MAYHERRWERKLAHQAVRYDRILRDGLRHLAGITAPATTTYPILHLCHDCAAEGIKRVAEYHIEGGQRYLPNCSLWQIFNGWLCEDHHADSHWNIIILREPEQEEYNELQA